MREHFQDELGNLKQLLLQIAALGQTSIENAIKAFSEKDELTANTVIAEDRRINIEEVRFEEECLKVLALYQPVAIDLRVIIAYLKINNDLERIGDLASNIATKALYIAKIKEDVSIDVDYRYMGEKAKNLFEKSLESLIHLDTKTARTVIKQDDEVDAMKRQYTSIITKKMKESPELIETLLRYLSVIRALERIADMAVNLAEDVIYIVEGNIIRHQLDTV